MAMQSNDEFMEGLARMHYAASLPWERWLINRDRRRAGKDPIRL